MITLSMASDYFNVLIISLIFTLLMLSLEILKAMNTVNRINCNIISEVKSSASCFGKIAIIGSFIAWHISYTKLNDENMKFTHKFGNITLTYVWHIITRVTLQLIAFGVMNKTELDLYQHVAIYNQNGQECQRFLLLSARLNLLSPLLRDGHMGIVGDPHCKL